MLLVAIPDSTRLSSAEVMRVRLYTRHVSARHVQHSHGGGRCHHPPETPIQLLHDHVALAAWTFRSGCIMYCMRIAIPWDSALQRAQTHARTLHESRLQGLMVCYSALPHSGPSSCSLFCVAVRAAHCSCSPTAAVKRTSRGLIGHSALACSNM